MMIHTASDSEYFAVSLVSTSKLICEKRNMSRNCSSGGMKPMDFPPLSEGEEEVVLEHSTHMDEAMAQDKITTATPTKLICDGKTQEKAEDKLDADDLERVVIFRGRCIINWDEEQSGKAIMEVIQGHARVNAMWPVFGNHGGTSQDHSHLSLKEITTRDSETANKSHEEGELDAVSHRGEEDWIRVDPKSKGRNRRRMSNLTKFKWVQRPNQVYSKRKMKGKVTLKAG
ncbi:hypothetical protein LguiB_008637 [Lonicera macranthoides]